MEFKEGNIPLYFQFYLKIKNDILLGEIEPGSRLPNIEKLHVQYGVSHATVRRSLGLLEKENLILKKRGMGIFVRDRVDLPIWNPTSLVDITHVAMQDLVPEILFSGWATPPHRVAKHFADRPGAYHRAKIFKIRRLWISLSDPRRKRITDAYLAASIVFKIGAEKIRVSHFQQALSEHFANQPIKIRQTVRPWICDVDTAELLKIPDGTPVFHRTWIRLNPDNDVISVSETITTANSLVRDIQIEAPLKIESLGRQL